MHRGKIVGGNVTSYRKKLVSCGKGMLAEPLMSGGNKLPMSG